ncbi:MAG: DUF484 family protein [Candidatus Competibacteraceae bacterium]
MNEEESIEDPEQAVATYLRLHPEFFSQHLELLESLSIPHPCRPAASLLEYQNRLLRERGQRLHGKLLELVAIARDNNRLSERVQRLALGLLDARGGLDELLQGIKAILRDEFKADCIALCLAAPLTVGLSAVEEFLRPDVVVLFDAVFRAGRPQCGRLSADQAAALYGEGACRVSSAALIPLGGDEWRGLLAVGSGDVNRFHPGVGTLFLERIGELVTQALQARLLGDQQRAMADPPAARGSG